MLILDMKQCNAKEVASPWEKAKNSSIHETKVSAYFFVSAKSENWPTP